MKPSKIDGFGTNAAVFGVNAAVFGTNSAVFGINDYINPRIYRNPGRIYYIPVVNSIATTAQPSKRLAFLGTIGAAGNPSNIAAI